MGSKSKMNLMKSYKINKKEAEQKLKKQQKENSYFKLDSIIE